MRLSSRPKQVRTLIVNGEPAMRAQLQRLCADRPDLDVIAEAASGSQAIKVIRASDTDLLLLDARLPDMSGFELLRSLIPAAAPAAVMLTSASDDAGRRPGDLDVSYLVKPVEPPLFNAAIDSAIDPARAEAPAAHGQWPMQIIGEKSCRIYFLDPHDVEYLASAGNYVVTHMGGNEFLTRATLRCLVAELAPLGFVQIERSLLVNLRQVAHVERCDRGQYCFVMRSGARLVSSRERSGRIRSMLLGATSSPQP